MSDSSQIVVDPEHHTSTLNYHSGASEHSSL